MENYNEVEVVGQPLENGESRKFGIYESALGTIMFILFNIIFEFLMEVSGIQVIYGSVGYYVLSCLVEGVFALAAYVVATSRQKSLIIGAGLDQKINWKIVLLTFGVAAVSIICFSSITNLFLEILAIFGYKSILGSLEINTSSNFLGFVVSACLVAPICEELLFRGVILSGFKKYGAKVAIICSALIFTFMHGNAEQTVHQFIIGVVIGVAFYKTGNFWIGFFIHAFNNLIPVTLSFVMSFFPSETAAEAGEVVTITLASVFVDMVVAAIFMWAGIYFIKLLFKYIYKENSKLNNKVEEEQTVSAESSEEIEMIVDGQVIKQNNSKKAETLPASVLWMFLTAGVYLALVWLFNTIGGFLL